MTTDDLSIGGSVIGDLVPAASATYDLGAPGAVWKDLYLSGNSLYLGDQSITSNAGGIQLSNTISVTDLYASGNVTAQANVIGGNVLTGGLISATSTITSSANITGSNLLTGGLISASSTITSAANITGANVLTAGFVTASGNVTGGNLNTGGLITATGNITGGNVRTGGLISATGTVTGSTLIGSVVTASGNIVGGNVNTVSLSLSGNVISDINTTNNITTTANVNAGNLNSARLSVSGNVDGANVNAGTAVFTPSVTNTGAITISSGSNGNINIQPNGTGNIVLANTYINSLAMPQQDYDAATKLYVDNLVTTGFAFHQPVAAATTGTLAAATGGTISYAQPNGAGNGIGATLTTTGTFYLIDTANIQTVGTRILVKNEGNAVFNGVYTYANTTTIVRSTDADQYGADSTEALSINDYFFVQTGNVNAGSAYVVSAPTGTITFGTSNIEFSQFSSSQTYTANTAAGISLNGTVINAKVDNDTTAFDGGGNIIVKASANLTTPNIGAATGTSLSVTGTVTSGNINAGSGYITTTGNVTGGNILTGGLISAASSITAGANITGGNILTGGLISAGGNITGGNLSVTSITGTLLTNAQPNITSVGVLNELLVANTILADGIQSRTGSDFTVSANGTNKNVVLSPTGSGIVSTSAIISAGGNVIGANILTSGLISAGGNITGGNILFGSGIVSGIGNIYGGNIFQSSNQVLDTMSTVDGGTY